MIHDIPRTFVLTVDKTWSKWETTHDHLKQHGIEAEPFIGIDKTKCRLEPEMLFELNARGEKMGQGPLVTYLTHYMAWMVMQYLPEDVFWVLEDDAQLTDNWRYDYSEAMSVLPEDWDIVFLGSCCTHSQFRFHVDKNLFVVRYPMCTHAVMYRKKALPTLLRIHQKIWAPLDIAMKYDSLPSLNVYTILPRIVNQRGSFIMA